MGNKPCLNNTEAKRSGPTPTPSEVLPGEACKRQKLLSTSYENNSRLIPSLPNEISTQILARVPRICYLNLKSVSRAWKASLMCPELFCLRKELGTAEEWLYILTRVNPDKLILYALDPLSGRWQRLPPVPHVSFEDEAEKGLTALSHRVWSMLGSSIKIGDVIMNLIRRKNVLDQVPFCGCSIGAVGGCIYALGGFSNGSAMKSVWKYDPVKNSWTEATPMSVRRASCKTGMLKEKLYVVGGVSRHRRGLIPLRSAEVYDPHTGTWSQLPSMPFAKAQVIPTDLLADYLKPVATGLTSCRGRLFVPQSLLSYPFSFCDIGGEVYDPDTNSWRGMPIGMGGGWPESKAGVKLGVAVNDDLYALDPSNSLHSAKIKVYDEEGDTWKIVAEDVPIHAVIGLGTPYLLASLLGKLHLITRDANHSIKVLQMNLQNNLDSSQSLLSSPDSSFVELAESSAESKPEIWRAFASRSGRFANLISCQSLKV